MKRQLAEKLIGAQIVLALVLTMMVLNPMHVLLAGPFFMDAGKAIVTNFLVNATGVNQPKYHAMGTGVGPADSTATALTTEVESRATGTLSRVTTTVTNDTYQSVGTQTATTARAITEVGLFDASSTGNMFIGSGITAVNLANGDSLQITFKAKFA
jgi:hypothetical protein